MMKSTLKLCFVVLAVSQLSTAATTKEPTAATTSERQKDCPLFSADKASLPHLLPWNEIPEGVRSETFIQQRMLERFEFQCATEQRISSKNFEYKLAFTKNDIQCISIGNVDLYGHNMLSDINKVKVTCY